jgi:hypothetical protein
MPASAMKSVCIAGMAPMRVLAVMSGVKAIQLEYHPQNDILPAQKFGLTNGFVRKDIRQIL